VGTSVLIVQLPVAVDEEVPLATVNKTDHKQPRFTIYFI